MTVVQQLPQITTWGPIGPTGPIGPLYPDPMEISHEAYVWSFPLGFPMRISHGEILINARVVGGIPMIDGGEADDKIIAVLDNDDIFSHVQDISELPETLVERLRHYFKTYKTLPDEPEKVQIGKAYGREHAAKVIEAAAADYREEFRES